MSGSFEFQQIQARMAATREARLRHAQDAAFHNMTSHDNVVQLSLTDATREKLEAETKLEAEKNRGIELKIELARLEASKAAPKATAVAPKATAVTPKATVEAPKATVKAPKATVKATEDTVKTTEATVKATEATVKATEASVEDTVKAPKTYAEVAEVAEVATTVSEVATKSTEVSTAPKGIVKPFPKASSKKNEGAKFGPTVVEAVNETKEQPKKKRDFEPKSSDAVCLEVTAGMPENACRHFWNRGFCFRLGKGLPCDFDHTPNPDYKPSPRPGFKASNSKAPASKAPNSKYVPSLPISLLSAAGVLDSKHDASASKAPASKYVPSLPISLLRAAGVLNSKELALLDSVSEAERLKAVRVDEFEAALELEKLDAGSDAGSVTSHKTGYNAKPKPKTKSGPTRREDKPIYSETELKEKKEFIIQFFMSEYDKPGEDMLASSDPVNFSYPSGHIINLIYNALCILSHPHKTLDNINRAGLTPERIDFIKKAGESKFGSHTLTELRDEARNRVLKEYDYIPEEA